MAADEGRIEAAFGVGQVWKLSPTKEGNTIVLAGRDVVWPERDVLMVRAQEVEARFDLPATKWVRVLRPLPLDKTALADAPSPEAA